MMGPAPRYVRIVASNCSFCGPLAGKARVYVVREPGQVLRLLCDSCMRRRPALLRWAQQKARGGDGGGL